ncbi:MAG TPA: VOC family protein [Polyangiaceae bacterium]|nr:VOC family protein [Polyangiaceae bacterium]
MAPPTPLHHLALRTRDVARLAAFYRDVLGLPERARNLADGGALRSVWLDAGGVVVMIELAAPGEPAPPAGSLDLVAFAMSAGEREAFRARFAAAGAAVEAETAHTLYVRDPDGRRVGVSSYAFGAP